MAVSDCGPIRSVHMLDIALRREMEKHSDISILDDVTGTNGHIIMFLSHHQNDDIYQKDLETEFCITRSTVSRVLSLMEQKGFITRNGVESDARLKKICLTPKSLQIVELMVENKKRVCEVMFRGFSPDEMDRFANFIDRMRENLAKE